MTGSMNAFPAAMLRTAPITLRDAPSAHSSYGVEPVAEVPLQDERQIQRRALYDRWRGEPADQCGDRDDVEPIDQTCPQERAVEPATGLRHQALRPSCLRIFTSAAVRST
jgi:hypothetical protein